MIPVTLNGRWVLNLPEHRQQQWAQPWEAARLESMHANLRPGDLIVDAGAEEGDLPALWASWGCDVLPAEPSSSVWPNIRACFDGNDLTHRVWGTWVGFLGDEIRHASPEWQNEVVGASNPWPLCSRGEPITNHGFSVLVERPDIPVTTVDLLANLYGAPDAITIDVEGAELRVLRGARRTLMDHRPLVWVSVHTDAHWVAQKFPGDDEDAVYEFMASVGYKGHLLAEDHERHVFFVPTEKLGDVTL